MFYDAVTAPGLASASALVYYDVEEMEMSSKVVFFDVGGTLVNPPDLFEIMTKRISHRWPDKPTYDSILNIFPQIYREMEKQD
jgi:hypothetical protein